MATEEKSKNGLFQVGTMSCGWGGKLDLSPGKVTETVFLLNFSLRSSKNPKLRIECKDMVEGGRSFQEGWMKKVINSNKITQHGHCKLISLAKLDCAVFS